MAARMAKAPPVIAAMIKRSLYQSAEADLRTSLDLVSSHMGIVRSTSESRLAFTETRDRIVQGADGNEDD
jgi:enoyl-CoA hydratase/carnithine racemase